MANIYVTRKIPEVGLDLLKNAGHIVSVSEKDSVLTQEELIGILKEKEYDAVLCTLNNIIDGTVMDAAPSVKIFANYAVGYNNIDVEAAKERGVTITNTPGVLTDAVAEHTIALIFAITKRISEADRFVKEGKFDGWAPMLFLTSKLQEATLGLIGCGRIGARVSEIANAMGMKVVYYDIHRSEDLEKTGVEYRESLDELLKESDIVSLHVPLLDSTHHLINKEKLSLMKETAFLVNTARGPVVDERALVEALKNKVIAGAALDVFEEEPELTSGLAGLENVILTPHMASATTEAREAMSEIAARNIIDFLSGNEPKNIVF